MKHHSEMDAQAKKMGAKNASSDMAKKQEMQATKVYLLKAHELCCLSTGDQVFPTKCVPKHTFGLKLLSFRLQ